MREIKFKIWNLNSHSYIDHDSVSYTTVLNSIDGLILTSNEYIYLQYTGLKDKNDKEIYEGDIVAQTRWKIFPNRQEVISLGYRILPAELDCSTAEIYEVIGNIYENPELLNGLW